MRTRLRRRLLARQTACLALGALTVLSLTIPVGQAVRAAGVGLLLLVALIGFLAAWGLAATRAKWYSAVVFLAFFGPLGILVRIGDLGAALFQTVVQALSIGPRLLIAWRWHVPPDVAPLLTARSSLLEQSYAVYARFVAWESGLMHQIPIEDPVILALVFSLGMWLLAAWAGWQLRRNARTLAGVLPISIVLGLTLNNSSADRSVLWLHLSAFLFLLALNNYDFLTRTWERNHIDFAEAIGESSLLYAAGMAALILSLAFLVSTVSIKEIIKNLRATPTPVLVARGAGGGAAARPTPHVVSGLGGSGLPQEHLIGAGPELSQEVVMTISTGDLPPMPGSANPTPPRYYWRTLSYQIYTGSGWSNPPVETTSLQADEPLTKLKPNGYRTVQESVTFTHPSDDDRLYWPGVLVRASVPLEAAWYRQASPNLNDSVGDNTFYGADLLAALANAQTYQTESLVLDMNVDDLRHTPSYYPEPIRTHYLTLPDSVPERVLSLARDLTASKTNPYDRAIAIQDYLRRFPYSLDVPAPPTNRDVADYFLFDLKKGYCDYYATAMVVLARAAGLPARLVSGYAGGTYDAENAHYIITAADAHSWVEIYFTSIGWVTFEPTAGSPTVARPAQSQHTASTADFYHAPTLWDQLRPRVLHIVAVAIRPTLGVLALLLLWILTEDLRLSLLPPPRAIRSLYRRLRRSARPVTGRLSADQTANEFAALLEGRLARIEGRPGLGRWLRPAPAELGLLTELYTRSLFAASPPGKTETRRAVWTWSRLRWRLWLANLLSIGRQNGEN